MVEQRPQRSRRGRRPPDRLAAPERHLRHRHQVGRVVRGAALHDRPHQRRTVVDFDAHRVADRRRPEAGARGTRPARLPDRAANRRTRPARRPRRLRRRRLLFDHQPEDARPPWRPLARGRTAADGLGDRDRERPCAVPQAARRARRRPGGVRRRGRQGGAGISGARPSWIRVHDERDFVGAARRGRASRGSRR